MFQIKQINLYLFKVLEFYNFIFIAFEFKDCKSHLHSKIIIQLIIKKAYSNYLINQSKSMASKQPYKLINITQKLTTWSIRINKFLKHRLLSKRKHVLIIGDDQP